MKLEPKALFKAVCLSIIISGSVPLIISHQNIIYAQNVNDKSNKWNNIVSNIQILQDDKVIGLNTSLNPQKSLLIKGLWTNDSTLVKDQVIMYNFINEKPINLPIVSGEVWDNNHNLVGHIKLDSLNSQISIVFDTDYITTHPNSKGSWFVNMQLMNQNQALPPYKMNFPQVGEYKVNGTINAGGDAIAIDGIFEIKKSGTSDLNLLKGATYNVFDNSGKLVETLVTNEQGIAMSKPLPAGRYKIIEIVAPQGYQVDKSDHFVDVVAGISTKQMVIVNLSDIETKVKIIKSDIAGKKLLANAHFAIENDKGQVIINDVVTNSNGEVNVTKLPIGKYYLTETKAPNGYKLNGQKISFEITKDKGEVVINVKDEIEQSENTNVNPNLTKSINSEEEFRSVRGVSK